MSMESSLFSRHYDLVTPDGAIVEIKRVSPNAAEAVVSIEKIAPSFVGYRMDPKRVFFNAKSTLAQLGINGVGHEYELDAKTASARVRVLLTAFGEIGMQMLEFLQVGCYIGKLFAADEKRRVRDPDYLRRMFERADSKGRPLLSLGGMQGMNELVLEKIEGRTVAFLSLLDGVVKYGEEARGCLPTLARALLHPEMPTRSLLQIDQMWYPEMSRKVQEGELLLVKTRPLHIRTMFGKVVEELLPKGYAHMTASVLEPTTTASGDMYELYGKSEFEITDMPIEFYTLEPYREYVFFTDREQLHASLADPDVLFKAFESSPGPENHGAAVYIVKESQLLNLTPQDWTLRDPRNIEFPGLDNPERQVFMIERFIQGQPEYPFLKGIEDGLITSQGILLSRYFPTPLIKRMLLNNLVQRCLRRIYFLSPSLTYREFFSHEDRSLLHDLAKFAVSSHWVDKRTGKILQYVIKPYKDTGMFVPEEKIEIFKKMTAFGIYGSNLLSLHLESEFTQLMQGLDEMRFEMNHALFNKDTPLGVVTGGGPGIMEMGNRVAKSLNILSCARIVDFRAENEMENVINEQQQNPFIDAKMTYRLDRLIERQAEFNLDFPIFLMGGIGTDFEFCLEELRRKVGSSPAYPILVFGDPAYWQEKITPRFQANLRSGTIAGSEWISNCIFCVQHAAQGLKIYRSFFSGTLKMGKNAPFYKEGFVIL
jgi:predicted Rossmann-fold nucleotide-binding protein